MNQDEKYFKRVFQLYEEYINNNKRAIMAFCILNEIMDNLEEISLLEEFTKDEGLLKLFENNFIKYIEVANEQKKKLGLSGNFNDNELVIDDFTHKENVTKRLEFLSFIVTNIYFAFDFIPLLKKFLIENAVSPNDQYIFSDFIRNYISYSSQELSVK